MKSAVIYIYSFLLSVFDGCVVEIEGETFKARHGSVILIPTNCSRCLCYNGEAQYCREARENCSSLLVDAPQSCLIEGMREVEHGETFKVSYQVYFDLFVVHNYAVKDKHTSKRCN